MNDPTDDPCALDPLQGARRIVQVGVTGSGKTTSARRIAEATGLPWHSVDDLTHEPGWVPVQPDEQRRRMSQICAGDAWILDTYYGAWADVATARAQLVIALDYPRWLSFARLLRRTIRRIRSRELVCNGNVETWRGSFADRDSILMWHLRSYRRKRRRIRALLADVDGPRVVRFTHPRELDEWIARLRPVEP